jgi:hypothetical protein
MVPAQVPSYSQIYFTVEDVDKTHQEAVELGAHEMLAPPDFSGGRFSILSDQNPRTGLSGRDRPELLSRHDYRRDHSETITQNIENMHTVVVQNLTENNNWQSGRPALRLSAHSIQRWRERAQRFDRSIDPRVELGEFVRNGHKRPTPRRWTTVRPVPGLTFIYWAERPEICALVKDATVVTVLTRSLCKGHRYEFEELLELPVRLPVRHFAPATAEAA